MKNKGLHISVVFYLLIAIILLVGIFCLFFGIKNTYYSNQKTKNYLTTTAYYNNYEIYDVDDSDNNTTYRLIYVYKVNDKEYTIKTDYGTSFIPDKNSEKQIKYNPNNPSEAIFLGLNKNNILIYFGAFFFLVGMMFVFIFLFISGVFDKAKIDILGLCIGLVFFIIGIGFISFQLAELSSLSAVIKSLSFFILIPILFIVVGFFEIIKSLFLIN